MDNIAQETLQLIQYGNLDLDFSIQYGILLLGLTKAGKTTGSHYLARQLLVGDHNEAESVIYKIQAGDSRFSNANIGIKENKSETQIPNIFQNVLQNPSTHLIDCPGYLDTYGCSRVISNGYFHFKVFSKVKNAKFILTVQYNDFDGTAINLRSTFKSFYEGFKNFQLDKEKIFAATCLLVTKVPQNRDLQFVKNRFERTQPFRSGVMKEAFNQFKYNILNIDNPKLFIFEAAQLGRNCDNQNSVLQRINQATIFWQRTTNQQKQADLSNIKISVRDRILKTVSDDKQFEEQLEQIGEYFKAKMVNKLNKYKKVQQILVEEAFGTKQHGKYMQQIDNYVNQFITPKQNLGNQAKYNKYQTKRQQNRMKLNRLSNIEMSASSANGVSERPLWLKKIQAIQKIYVDVDNIIKNNNDQYHYTIQGMSENSKLMINTVKSIINLSQQRPVNARKFGYDIYSLVETSYCFYQILKDQQTFEDIDSPLGFILTEYSQLLRDILYTLLTESLISKKIKFALNLDFKNKAVFSNQKQYKPIRNFLIDIQNSIQIKRKDDLYGQFSEYKPEELNAIVDQLREQQISLGLMHFSMVLFYLSANNFNISQARETLKQIEQIRKKIQILFNKKSYKTKGIKIKRIKCINLMAETIMKIPGRDSDALALDLYNFTSNIFKIFEFYREKQASLRRNHQKQEWYIFLIKYAKMAIRYHKFTLAKQKLEEATYLAIQDQNQKVLRIIQELNSQAYTGKEDAQNLGSEQYEQFSFDSYSCRIMDQKLVQAIQQFLSTDQNKPKTPNGNP